MTSVHNVLYDLRGKTLGLLTVVEGEYTQVALAEKYGTTPRTISRWVNGG